MLKLGRLIGLFLLVIIPVIVLQAAPYRPWSENVFVYVKQHFGDQAAKRMRYLHGIILENQDKQPMEKLQIVNDTLNRLPWIADEIHWKNADYWATPIETIATFGGDCEDIAIVKWVMLRHLGISANKLRLAYVKIKQSGESHMVLVYIEDPTQPPGKSTVYVLDNYMPEIKKGSERTDLLAVYLTDAEGTVTLIADNGTDRTVKGVYEKRKMKKLEDLKQKIESNRKKSAEINDGFPLLPEDV